MSADTNQSTKTARLMDWGVPALLLALVLIGPAIYLDATIGADENIWEGMGLLWTAMWGVPWSLPIVFGIVPIESGNLAVALFTACALLNVLILTLAFRRRSSRAGTPQ
jgi:hypothetical protein